MKNPLRSLTSPESEAPSFSETLDLAKRYFLQETVGPLKHIGRTLAFGLAGAVVAGVGATLCLIGLLRALQFETGSTFSGDWSFAPYVLTALVGVAVIVASVAIGLRGLRTDRRGHDA
jgi:hypothetical protein